MGGVYFGCVQSYLVPTFWPAFSSRCTVCKSRSLWYYYQSERLAPIGQGAKATGLHLLVLLLMSKHTWEVEVSQGLSLDMRLVSSGSIIGHLACSALRCLSSLLEKKGRDLHCD
jgi:hypothetical protein